MRIQNSEWSLAVFLSPIQSRIDTIPVILLRLDRINRKIKLKITLFIRAGH